MELFQHSIAGAVFLLAVLGVVLAATMPGMDRWNRRYFMTFFTILVLNMAAAFVEIYAYAKSNTTLMLVVGGFLDSLLPSLLILMPLAFLLHCCGEDFRRSRLTRVALAIWLTYVVMLVVAQFTTYFYYYTPEGELVRGTWYPLVALSLLAIIAIGPVHNSGKAIKFRSILDDIASIIVFRRCSYLEPPGIQDFVASHLLANLPYLPSVLAFKRLLSTFI